MERKPISKFQNIQPTPFHLVFNLAAQVPDLINLGIGEPDLGAPKEVIEAVAKAAKDGFTHYPPLNGFMDLKQEISAYWKKRYNLDCGPGEVIVTAGCTQGLDMILRACVESGDEVLLTDPCFSSYVPLVSYTGATPVMVPVRPEDDFILKAEELERHITPKTKLLLINSPCNPTGAVYDRATMEEIAKVVEKHDLLVISDEIYETLIFEGEHVCFATLPGMKDRTFTLGGFSKSYAMTGMRLGYILAPQEFIPALSVLTTNMAMSVNSVTQKAGVVALRECQYFVDDMTNLYKERAKCIVGLIEAIPGLSCIKPRGTFYVMMDISRTKMKSVDFAMRLIKEKGVATIAGSAFGETADDFVRLSFNGSPDFLKSAMERIGGFVEQVL